MISIIDNGEEKKIPVSGVINNMFSRITARTEYSDKRTLTRKPNPCLTMKANNLFCLEIGCSGKLQIVERTECVLNK